MVWADFPKVKICQKKSPEFWCRPKKIDKISKKSFLDRSWWVLSESAEKNKNKIGPSLWKNLLLCCPNLEAVLLKYIATLLASKITLLWLPFHQWHHFSRPSHCQWGRWWKTDHEISRVTPVAQEKWGKWSWGFSRRDGHAESNTDKLDEQDFSERLAEMVM